MMLEIMNYELCDKIPHKYIKKKHHHVDKKIIDKLTIKIVIC